VLELEDVTYTYPGTSVPALQSVSLEVAPGQLVVVAGASGSGKSTLLRVASGLVPHFHGGVFAGRAVVAGLDTRENGPGELARALGTLFQDPETQVVMGTVRAELSFPLENRGQEWSAIARAVEETALALGIAHLLDRPTAELSGGELQRVALGAALAGRPQLVVLDEPTSQLDPVAGDELIGLLRRCNEDSDTAILLVEHRLERCLGSADRVLAVDGGRIVCDAPPEGFLAWAAQFAPRLQTPGAKLLGGVGLAPVAGVKHARASLRDGGRLVVGAGGERPTGVMAGGDRPAGGTPPEEGSSAATARAGLRTRLARRRGSTTIAPALAFEHVWHELRSGPTILRDVSLQLAPRERVALMGRNGAGKSTLLRHAAGLMRPSRGRVRSSGRVALLLQNPNDYLVHELVAQEAPASALDAVGLAATELAGRHPRELSGGEKQRLALAVVLGDGTDPAAVVCLDEPTRGMDRDRKEDLAALLGGLEAAVLVATHDPEFVAAFADRVVLLADGAPIADGPAREVLAGGSYFATETARILGGAGGALTPAEGVALLQRAASAPRREAIA
jgi:energy-coupling factor transport system ATP-binding protein